MGRKIPWDEIPDLEYIDAEIDGVRVDRAVTSYPDGRLTIGNLPVEELPSG